ncbi:hypothetical protein [Curvivirga aplysinae]|uniref:hypothetical protein n=1 Tax=Curvivirga aplysinae TaxID=2529852 RepID=UPI0012BBAB18|nr:hypothetical protein [Curvivirga aplysinae]
MTYYSVLEVTPTADDWVADYIGHSALDGDGIEDVSQPNIRMSLESRALVRYS